MPNPVTKAAFPKSLNGKMTVVPDAGTAVTSTDTILYSIHATNLSAGAETLRIYDGQRTAGEIVPTQSIAANSRLDILFPDGVLCPGGVNWVASAADSIHCVLNGTYK